MSSRYIVALGSNRRHAIHGDPRDVLRAAMEELAALGTVMRRSRVFTTAPLGPARRRFANAACMIDSDLDPPAFLVALKWLEREFGRRRGRRWGDRVLDLDIVLWSGGRFEAPGLSIPHRAFRSRRFVIRPAGSIAPRWRDPLTGLTLRQLDARLTRARPLPR